jgi:Leucine-rich repeat (LRR) protein
MRLCLRIATDPSVVGMLRFVFLLFRELRASNNDISDCWTLRSCTSLEVIDLSRNDIEDADMIRALLRLPQLQVLYVNGNNLTAVDKQALRDETNERVLDGSLVFVT